MKKLVFIFLAVTFSIVASGQIILTGNWELNTSKSKLNEQFSIAPKLLIVSQTDSLLILEKKMVFQGQESTLKEQLYLSGQESTNDGIMESVKKSKTELTNEKKTIKITSKITTNDGGEINSIEEYSNDNEYLTYKITSSSSFFGEMSEIAVYDKK